jgi:hypothetical protein
MLGAACSSEFGLANRTGVQRTLIAADRQPEKDRSDNGPDSLPPNPRELLMLGCVSCAAAGARPARAK